MGHIESSSPVPHYSPTHAHSHSHHHLPPSPTHRSYPHQPYSSSHPNLSSRPSPPLYSGTSSPHYSYRQQIQTRWWCDSCQIDLTYRPRICCTQCANFDLCCNCYLLRAEPPPHLSSHPQQTVLPPPGQLRGATKKNPNATFSCDVCGVDISSLPRAHCLECINFDLCADCHVIQASTGSASNSATNSPVSSGSMVMTKDNTGGSIENRHSSSHKMNVIAHNAPLTSNKLMTDELYPTNLYIDLIDAIFTFIYKAYGIGTGDLAAAQEEVLSANGLNASGIGEKEKRRSLTKAQPREHYVQFELLEAKKLAKFYKAMGMQDFENSYLMEPHVLANQYSLMGIEFYLVPSHSIRKRLADRTFPWQLETHPSAIFTTMPTEPAMTRQGFLRSFVLGTLLNPSGTHFILQNVLSTGLVTDKVGNVYRGYIPRSCLPTEPVSEVLGWENGLGL